jgi:hypothetical protein
MFTRSALVAAAAVLCAAAQAPVNDLCANAIAIYDGVNPNPPSGASLTTFTNDFATNSVGMPAVCASLHKDVWFTYTPPRTGVAVIKTCTPAGFTPGSLSDTAIAVYAPGCATTPTLLGCNDNGGCSGESSKSTVTFNCFAGFAYLVRVGSTNSLASGSFYLTVTDPGIATAGFCSFAPNAIINAPSTSTIDGTSPAVSDPVCGLTGGCSIWLKYDSGVFFNNRELVLSVSGGGADHVSVYSGSNCSSLTSLGCATTLFTTALNPLTTYWFRFTKMPTAVLSTLTFNYAANVVDGPPNDFCVDRYAVENGSYPRGAWEAQYFTNVGASTESGYGSCASAPANSDVFYEYVATTSGAVQVTTATPIGATPGSLGDTVLFVYSACGGTLLACNDDSVGFLSSLTFAATQGSSYVVRVAGYGSGQNEGSFYLTIKPLFSLTMSSPAGAGSFRLKNANGPAGHAVYNCLTIYSGSYPNGPFFGIEPTYAEIELQLAYAQAPFVVGLDGSGSYQFDYSGVLPPLTVYGVGLLFDLSGQIAGVSAPTHHAIP